MTTAIILRCCAIIVTALFYGCASTIDAPSRGAKLCVTKAVAFPAFPINRQTPDTARIHLASCSTDPVVIVNMSVNGDGVQLLPELEDTTILPGDTIYVRVLYFPEDSIPDVASIIINSNAGSLSIPVTGAGIGPSRSISAPPVVNFGKVRLGLCEDSLLGQKAELLVTIRNTGSEKLHLDTVTITAPFEVLSVPCDSIFPGDSCRIRIGFCPIAYGEVIGQLRIASDAVGADALKIVSVRGTGIVYLPGRGSFWREKYNINDSLSLTTQKDVADSNVTGLGGPKENLFVRSKTAMSDLDTSWYFSTADTSNVSIYINAGIRGFQDPVYNHVWYPFTKAGRFDTTFSLNDGLFDVTDSVVFIGQRRENFGDRTVHFHKARWHRIVLIDSEKVYEAEAELWYAKTLGIVFIRRTYDTQSNRNVIHDVSEYDFR